ncbi:MAG: hypothetical protein ACFFAA_05455 [Promethearchaeota archaeon]
MANFCKTCGKPMQTTWQFCPYCSDHAYNPFNNNIPKNLENSNLEIYNPSHIQSQQSDLIGSERKEKKRFTKRQKKALIIGVVILAVAVITPIASILIYQYLFPQRTVNFYVNNGNTLKSYTISTSREVLDFYESEPHPFHTSADPYYIASVIESFCTPNYTKIIQIAEDIKSECIDQFDSEEIINGLLSFSQAVGYKAELVDLTQYPMETLFNQGDCEDLSVLFGSLVVALGYEAILVIINYYDTETHNWIGHACVGVYLNFTPTQHSSYPPSHSFTVDSKEYWICETTSQGWMVGQLPTANPSHYVMEGYAFIN